MSTPESPVQFSHSIAYRRVYLPVGFLLMAGLLIGGFCHAYKLVFVGVSDRCIPGYVYIVERGVQPKAGELAMVHSHETELIPAGIPLLKLVAAVDGDTVDVSSFGVTVGEKTYPAPLIPSAEALEIPIETLTGKRKVDDNSLFMIGTFSGSYDSRFFGSVSRDQVVGRAFVLF